MEIFPAIDLLEGKCVRLNQGDYQKVTEFDIDPINQALKWERLGAKKIHLVDLNAAKTGDPVNDETIRQIKKALTIPIQLGGGIRSYERAIELIKYGIENIILGTVAIEKPELVTRLAEEFPGKISVGIDAKNGKVATRGWVKKSNIDSLSLVKDLNALDLASIISTDISKDGTLEGPNIQSLKEIAEISKNPVIASGGIGTVSDLISLKALNHERIKGIIVGRALYDGSVDLVEAINAVSKPFIKDNTEKSSNHIA